MTYAGLAALFLAGALLVLGCATLLHRPDRRWWLATGATALTLVLLTGIFDNVMIAADLFRFDSDQLSGWKVGLAPVEDFAWPLGASALLPAVALLLGRRQA